DWAMTPLTTLSLGASTTFSETSLPGASGAVERELSLAVKDRATRRLTLGGKLDYQQTDYSGLSQTDRQVQASLTADYAFGRGLTLNAGLSRTWFRSTTGLSWIDDRATLGLAYVR
ncbi:MAG: outer membrane beta-barrel protein, partial [Hyphomicrobiales bacterium]|nr:outer membrane beta-barrel protein [Hyphomicrobiales bacterium]